jgi:hypothetical protein
MKIFKRIKPSKIEELNKDEELIHTLENTRFPKNASWRKRGSWNNTVGLKSNEWGRDINSKSYHGSIYITNMRLIFEGGRESARFNKESWSNEIDRGICTINLEEIIQFKYSVVDQWLWEKHQLRKKDINPKYKYEIERIIGKKIKYETCPFGLELLIEKRNGESEKFMLPKATSGIVQKLENHRKNVIDKMTTDAKNREIALDYDGAIQLWEKVGKIKEATKVRKLKAEQIRVDQTVVHGDYVDDRDTIIKDSVLNRTNVGASEDKFTKLKELKEMFDSGFISKEEMEEVKKDILGK